MAVEKFIAVHYEDPEKRGSHNRVLVASSLEEIKDKVDTYSISRDDVTEVEGCSIDDIFGSSDNIKEGIADKVRASQDKKEMTKRAIRILKAAGGEYEDLVQEYKDTYGEDPLEESVESSDLHFVKRAFSYDIYRDGNSYVLLDGEGDVVYTSDNTLDCLKWAKKNSSKAWNFNNVWDWDRLKESSELTDKDWKEFYDFEDKLSKIMNSVDSDMDDYQGDIYHNTYDDTLRLHYLTYPSKVNNKWASDLEKKLRDFFEKSTRFTDVDYIDIRRKRDASPLDLPTYVVDIRAFDPMINREEESLKESFEGMTIKDWIVDGMTRAAEDRLQKLTDMNAPQVMIDRQSEMVDELKSGKTPITGDLEVLDLPLESREIKTGRGGKTYFSINGGKINYFPYAKYGPYIKMVSSVEESLKESSHNDMDIETRLVSNRKVRMQSGSFKVDTIYLQYDSQFDEYPHLVGYAHNDNGDYDHEYLTAEDIKNCDLSEYMDGENVVDVDGMVRDNRDYFVSGLGESLKESSGKVPGGRYWEPEDDRSDEEKYQDWLDKGATPNYDDEDLPFESLDEDLTKKYDLPDYEESIGYKLRLPQSVTLSGEWIDRVWDDGIPVLNYYEKNPKYLNYTRFAKGRPFYFNPDYYKIYIPYNNGWFSTDSSQLTDELGVDEDWLHRKVGMTTESLKESIDDFIGDTFIEDGVEYEWISQYGDELETSTGTWAVWEASPTESDDENPESYFFVVDVDSGLIDWGPCETVEEAAEFLESKESDEEDTSWYDDEYDYDAEYETRRDNMLELGI